MATAVVTGASSGIGYEFARLLAREKYDVVLVARNLDRLNDIRQEVQTRHGVRALVVPADLTREDAAPGICQEIRSAGLQVDMLINNAGFGYCGPYTEQSWENEQHILQVNLMSLAHLTRLILPDMIARKKGYICNVASTAAFFPGPFMAVYYATKAYVVSYSRALRNELRGSGVCVSALCPGPTATNFQTVANVQDTRLFQLGNMATAADVAEYGYRCLLKNKAVAIPGWSNRFLVFTSRFLPRETVTGMVRWVQETKKRSA